MYHDIDNLKAVVTRIPQLVLLRDRIDAVLLPDAEPDSSHQGRSSNAPCNVQMFTAECLCADKGDLDGQECCEAA